MAAGHGVALPAGGEHRRVVLPVAEADAPPGVGAELLLQPADRGALVHARRHEVDPAPFRGDGAHAVSEARAERVQRRVRPAVAVADEHLPDAVVPRRGGRVRRDDEREVVAAEEFRGLRAVFAHVACPGADQHDVDRSDAARLRNQLAPQRGLEGALEDDLSPVREARPVVGHDPEAVGVLREERPDGLRRPPGGDGEGRARGQYAVQHRAEAGGHAPRPVVQQRAVEIGDDEGDVVHSALLRRVTPSP